MQFGRSLFTILSLLVILATASSCEEDSEDSIVGTWELVSYGAEIDIADLELKQEIEDKVKEKYIFPTKGAIYVYKSDGTVTLYPNGLAGSSVYDGTYTFVDGELHVAFSYGGGLEYKNMNVGLNGNKMSVGENVTPTYQAGYPSLKRATRIHHVIRK